MLFDLVNNERKDLQDKTCIYKTKMEDTYYYKDREKLIELQEKYTIFNGHLEHETPMYIILTNNKFYFMETAVHLNPFNSSHFVWMDFGVNHVARNNEQIHNWIYKIPDKIKQLCINPYIENVENKIMFQNIYHHTAAGLFTGSKENILKYCDLFKEKTQQMYDEEWYQLDEAMMTMIQRENPQLFEFYYGDYQGIISNYVFPIHNIDLILQESQKFIDYNKTNMAYEVLCYCNTYFKNNPNDERMYYYIQQHIIVDYYCNNKLLLHDVINFINLLKNNNNNRIMHLLHLNRENIHFYANKNLIL